MEKPIIYFIFIILLLSYVSGSINTIKIYELENQGGESHNFTSKYPDLSNWSIILDHSKSYCSIGYWEFYDLQNFKVNSTRLGAPNRSKNCENKSHDLFKSARYFGPVDFDTPAIAFYEGTGNYAFGGQEYLIEGSESSSIPFVAKGAFSFGDSSWTLYSGVNFTGNPLCFSPNYNSVPTGKLEFPINYPVQSVVRGCDNKIN